MSVDRYTKAVLTLIAVCLVWLSLGGPSLIAPVSAQATGDRVILAGWVDESGRVLSFPAAPPIPDYTRPRIGDQIPMKPRTSSPLPVDQPFGLRP
jgi:hypothetical protein